jgi:hypothetical protein
MGVSLDPRLEPNPIDLIENLDARDICGPDLGEHRLHGILPRHAVRIGCVNDMQKQVRLDGLLQRGLERFDECVG